jgi:phytoene synthase
MESLSSAIDLEQGYRNCHIAANKFFVQIRWMTGNLPRNQRWHLDPLLNHLITIIDLLDLQSADGLSLDVWTETRDELNAALLGRFASSELAALTDVVRKYQIPKQFLFEPIFGVDHWIRKNRFATYDELHSFCGQVAGSWLASAVPVLGAIKPNYETAAYDCGRAVMLTQLLANSVQDARQNRIFLAEEDITACEVEIQRLKMRKPTPTLRHLVRLYCWRIEKLLNSGSHLLAHLDFDGRRTVTSLLGWTWKMMNQMRVNPDSILQEAGVLTRQDMFKLKAKHILGLEGNLPFDIGPDFHH